MSRLFILFLIIVSIIISLLVVYNVKIHLLHKHYLESIYTPKNLECSIDKNKSSEGLNFFSDKKIIIAGLIRNSSKTIPLIRKNLGKLTKIFKDYKMLIVENDSKDSTRKDLLSWHNDDPKITILGCGINANECILKLPSTGHEHNIDRIEKMSMLRNIYLSYITNHPDDFSGFDYTIIWDLDITGTFYIDGIGLSGYYFKNKKEVKGMCANGIKINNFGFTTIRGYFDPYAHAELGDRKNYSPADGIWRGMNQEQCESTDIRKVLSCFNGFAIYRTNAILNKKYGFDIMDGYASCEHTALHEQINGMYINPFMVFIVLDNN